MEGIKGFLSRKKREVLGGAVAFAAVAILTVAGPVKEVGAAPVTFTGVTLPFSVADMLTTAVNFLTIYAEWILIALGVIFAPVLYGLAMKLVSAIKAKTVR